MWFFPFLEHVELSVTSSKRFFKDSHYFVITDGVGLQCKLYTTFVLAHWRNLGYICCPDMIESLSYNVQQIVISWPFCGRLYGNQNRLTGTKHNVRLWVRLSSSFCKSGLVLASWVGARASGTNGNRACTSPPPPPAHYQSLACASSLL